MELDFFSGAFFASWLAASVRLAGPLLLVALGELYSERSGVLNIGIEGTMLLGAIASYLVAWQSGSTWFGLMGGILIGCIAGTYLSWMYITVQASQVVVGIIFNIFALGVASYVYRLALRGVSGPQTVEMFKPIAIPFLSEIPFIGPVLFNHTILLYATAGLVAVAGYVLFRTKFGLNLRAVGENPAAAETAGIRVSHMRYMCVIISGAAAGASGAYLVLAQIGQFRDTIVAGQGFIALAIVIFGRWSPYKAALAALIFGAADALQLSIQLFQIDLPPQLFLSLPYVLTILAMSGLVGKANQPEALMVPYRKE